MRFLIYYTCFIKKVTRLQVSGMLTGSVIFDSV